MGGLTLVCFVLGLYLSFTAPADYQQGETVRIMYIHVPAAWLGSFIYFSMVLSALGTLVWRHPLADVSAKTLAPIGAAFTFLCLVTGSLWGKPMWGTWWVWDARLTTELILLFLYIGYISLYQAIDDERKAAKAASLLAIIGVVNVPIIYFSVKWWNTLHQGATITMTKAPSMESSMLLALLLMTVAFWAYAFAAVFTRTNQTSLIEDHHADWVKAVLTPSKASS